jgi:hypothetical protein
MQDCFRLEEVKNKLLLNGLAMVHKQAPSYLIGSFIQC